MKTTNQKHSLAGETLSPVSQVYLAASSSFESPTLNFSSDILKELISRTFCDSSPCDFSVRPSSESGLKAWKLRAIDRIRRADLVIMPLEPHSWLDPFSLFEAQVCKRLGKDVFGLCLDEAHLSLTPFDVCKFSAAIIALSSKSRLKSISEVFEQQKISE